MDSKLLKVVFVAVLVVLVGFYALDGGVDWTSATSRTEMSTTTKVTTTTLTSVTTTMSPNPNALPECLVMDTLCKKDRCYFGNALNRHEIELCGQISDIRLRKSCVEKVDSDESLENSVIEGQVFNPTNCGVYRNLLVEVKNAENVTIASRETDSAGEYWFEVPTGEDYSIYVTIEGSVLNQKLSNVGNRRYIVDFALK